ncbi:MAG TPA: hypothetical protein VNA24_03920 [Hyalangium sp.]|jgi:hypothetical protein|nr:hypothetical protein [Hyalangium sp.]
MPLTPALRFEVLQALEKARQRVAHGTPTLKAAFHYQRLTTKAWVEVDRALDDVRFTVALEALVETALSQDAQSAEGRSLRDDLHAAENNARLPWSECDANREGLTRAQCVALLFIAREFLKNLPVTAAGPLLPHLPLTRSNNA